MLITEQLLINFKQFLWIEDSRIIFNTSMIVDVFCFPQTRNSWQVRLCARGKNETRQEKSRKIKEQRSMAESRVKESRRNDWVGAGQLSKD